MLTLQARNLIDNSHETVILWLQTRNRICISHDTFELKLRLILRAHDAVQRDTWTKRRSVLHHIWLVQGRQLTHSWAVFLHDHARNTVRWCDTRKHTGNISHRNSVVVGELRVLGAHRSSLSEIIKHTFTADVWCILLCYACLCTHCRQARVQAHRHTVRVK